jgi:WD40 repeat protein
MSVPLRQRVVEIEADLGEGSNDRWRYGSGFVIGGRTVLTAAHVVTAAVRTLVRGPDKRPYSAVVDPAWIGNPDALDLAVLEVPSLPEALPAVEVAIVDRGTSSGAFVEECWSVGYPAFQEVERDSSGRSVRETAHVGGRIPPLSGLVEGLLSFEVTKALKDLPPSHKTLAQSQWSGMSGAAVFAGDALVGVVAEHAPRRGESDITVTPLDALSDPISAPANAQRWWDRLGVRDPSSLPRLPPRRPDPTYNSTLQLIRSSTPELLDRDDEVEQIRSFALGSSEVFGSTICSGGYLWLVGDAWAGKTALLAEAVASLRTAVDVAAYFLIAREAQADREQFLTAVVPQLAWLLGCDPPAAFDLRAFRDLWVRCADRAARRGRNLLLIVDGLDEDVRPGGRSVAALLPSDKLGKGARVLVSSRPQFSVPGDVAVGHPLLSAPRVLLNDSPHAKALERLAEQEIMGLLSPDVADRDLAFDVLGVLVAAGGALSVEDIGAITGRRRRDVRSFVTQRAVRTIAPAGPEEHHRYAFAHQTLLAYCEINDDIGGDTQYREAVHEWVEQWRRAGWPTDTDVDVPRYLLDTYPQRLSADSTNTLSGQRLTQLVTDVGWLDTAIRQVGVDPVLAVLRAAAWMPGDTAAVTITQRLVRHVAHHLRAPRPFSQPGYVATALAWEALRLEADDIARVARDRLQQYPTPQLIPTWTTERAVASLVSVIGRHGRRVRALAVGDDGCVISGGADGAIRVWDPRTPDDPSREIGRLPESAFGREVRAVAVLPDGRVVSGGPDGRVRLWDPDKPGDPPGREIGRHRNAVAAITVSRDGHVVSGGLDGKLWVWDPDARDDRGRKLGRHRHGVLAVVVLADGRLVSGDADGKLRLWDPDKPRDPGRKLGRHHAGGVVAIAQRTDGSVVSGGSDGTVRLWQPDTPGDSGKEIGRVAFAGVRGSIRALAFSDERVVSGDRLGSVRVWPPAAPDRDHPLILPAAGRELGTHKGGAHAVAVLADGRVVSGGADGMVQLWDPEISDTPRRKRHAMKAFTARADGLLVCLRYDGEVRLWNPDTPDDSGRKLGRLKHRDRNRSMRRVSLRSDGRLFFADAAGVLWLWDPDARHGHCREIGGGRRPDVGAVLALADGRLVAAIEDAVWLWDPDTPDDPGRRLGAPDPYWGLSGWELMVTVLATRADGYIVSGEGIGDLRLWDPDDPDNPERPLRQGGGSGTVLALAVLAGGRIASGHDNGTVQFWDPGAPLWDPDTPRRRNRRLGAHGGAVHAVAALADGRIISGDDSGQLRLWDPDLTGDPGRELCCQDGAVQTLAARTDRGAVVKTPMGVTVFEITRPLAESAQTTQLARDSSRSAQRHHDASPTAASNKA